MKNLYAVATALVWVSCLTFSSCLDDNMDGQAIRYSSLLDREVNATTSQNIDVDDDGEPELLVVTDLADDNGRVVRNYRVVALRANAIFEVGGRALLLTEGQLIGPGNPFQKNVAPLVTRSEQDGSVVWQGDWLEANRSYLGFRMQLPDGSARYGWLRLSVEVAQARIILHDVAWQARPNIALRAGDGRPQL